MSTSRLRRARRWTLRIIGTLVVLFAVFITIVVIAGWEAFGKAPAGRRLEAMKESPQWAGSTFENAQPLWNDFWGSFSEGMSPSERSSMSTPNVLCRATSFE